ncbi:uncharacterized protein LOC130975230 [Arachis stenosperma]|uniref:uncharacterized protein LOC130975230 n=1 Tax=Arachis stenosperma TaxID=217475 RepID=UPI0025ABB513|nr:uncharacterized protein LOC130975230 [Arachis stenosperma]
MDNPFSEEITNYQMPKNFVLPTSLEPFNLLLRGASEILHRLLCSVKDICTRIRLRKHDQQGQHESLKDYMTRFAKATMEISDLDPKVHLHALKSKLRPGKFQEMITVTKPKTLEEFRERSAGQMEIEELREARKMDKNMPRREEQRNGRSSSNKDIKKPFKLNPKFDTYTRFNMKRENIIKEILHAKLIKPPIRAGSYQDQRFVDKNKHCAFHQKFGHTLTNASWPRTYLKD